MHERIRAPERSRSTQPTYEAWHDLSRFVIDTKTGPARRMRPHGDVADGDRSG